MKIVERKNRDPVASMNLTDAYMRWALDSTLAVCGEDIFYEILNEARLQKFIRNLPPENTEPPGWGITFKDYADLNAGLLNYYGIPGKSIIMNIGRLSTRKGIEHTSDLINLEPITTKKGSPTPTRVKMLLGALMDSFNQTAKKYGNEFKGDVEDGGEHWIYWMETDPLSAGKASEEPVGWLISAAIEEAGRYIFGKFPGVEQVACRATGEPASVWHVPKSPRPR